MSHLLHHGRIFRFIPIVSADDLKGLVIRKIFLFHIQNKVFILQCIGKEDPLWRLELYGQNFQTAAFKGSADKQFIYIDVKDIVTHHIVYKMRYGNMRLPVGIDCFQDKKLSGA